MAHYQLVEEAAIRHHNEYFEIRFSDHHPSLFFVSNDENLETTAAAVVADLASDAGHYQVVPHRKQ